MNNESTLECSTEETSSSTEDNKNPPLTSHVVNFKESKTHLFYVIQSDNDSNESTKHLIRIKLSKERPASRQFIAKKMLVRHTNTEDGSDKNQEKTTRACKANIASIYKRSDHPSFVVLPQIVSKRRNIVRVTTAKNQSTSENSNETYVVRSREDNKVFGSNSKVPVLLGTSLWNRSSRTEDAAFLHGTFCTLTL